MGRILKQGQDYYVEFNGNGLRFRKKAGQTEQEARARLALIEQSLEDTALPVDLATATMEDFVERFRIFAAEVYTSASRKHYFKTLTHFTEFLETHLPAPFYIKEVTPRVLEEYKAFLLQESSAAEVNWNLLIVRDILEYARSLRFLNDNPTQHLTFLPEGFSEIPETLQGVVPESEAERFVLATGLKREECEVLCWQDVDFKNQCVYVRDLREGESSRRIPLEAPLLSTLKTCRKGPEKKVFADCDLTGVPFALLRNTFAKNLLERGVPLFQLNRYLGCHDIAQVYPYGVFIPETR